MMSKTQLRAEKRVKMKKFLRNQGAPVPSNIKTGSLTKIYKKFKKNL